MPRGNARKDLRYGCRIAHIAHHHTHRQAVRAHGLTRRCGTRSIDLHPCYLRTKPCKGLSDRAPDARTRATHHRRPATEVDHLVCSSPA